MNEHLISTFNFNDITNKKLLTKILLLNNKTASVKLFSHLINCQYKWMARVLQHPEASGISWWEPIYSIDKLEDEWNKSLLPWLKFVATKTDNELATKIIFTGFDGGAWEASLQDIALQLNYHSIHHRAQIQMLLREQGVEPDFVDYIGTKYRKLN